VRLPFALVPLMFGVPPQERPEVALAVSFEHDEACDCDVCSYAAQVVAR
jgi:hypothetical protein